MNNTTMDNIRNMSEEEKLRICYNGSFEEYLNALTYDYMNDLIGTPFAI